LLATYCRRGFKDGKLKCALTFTLRRLTPQPYPVLTTPTISADNLRRLLALRGASLLAALTMALLAKPLFHILPDLGVLLTICGLWALFGAATWLRTMLPNAHPYPVRRYELLLHLATDLILLTTFLVFCGGTANPLTALYLMPVAAAAAVLPFAFAWTTAIVAIIAYALLWILAVPITVEDTDAAMQMHLAGMWLTFGLSAALLVGIISRMSAALREREQRLAAAREHVLRDERIVALGSLAAGAAHQLGTPLNTAILLADEIAASAPADSSIASDARELRTQIDRCREIVKGLLAETDIAQTSEAVTVSAWITTLVTHFRHLRGDCIPVVDIRDSLGDRLLHPETTLTQSLTDLLDNAADASPNQVTLTLESSDGITVTIRIRDAGDGFSNAALAHIGHKPWSDKAHGMGLGVYLARATAERLDGTLECRNTATGAEVVLRLPLASIGLLP
jgi:two-component system sensor histidine kinase RegB